MSCSTNGSAVCLSTCFPENIRTHAMHGAKFGPARRNSGKFATRTLNRQCQWADWRPTEPRFERSHLRLMMLAGAQCTILVLKRSSAARKRAAVGGWPPSTDLDVLGGSVEPLRALSALQCKAALRRHNRLRQARPTQQCGALWAPSGRCAKRPSAALRSLELAH
jgi:hypothetical protein